jgi:hypothetical protein
VLDYVQDVLLVPDIRINNVKENTMTSASPILTLLLNTIRIPFDYSKIEFLHLVRSGLKRKKELHLIFLFVRSGCFTWDLEEYYVVEVDEVNSNK